MPCDRRRFLALSGASLGAGPWLPAWTRPLPALHVLFEPAVAASAGFAAALPARSCIAIDLDQPLALMHAIGERLIGRHVEQPALTFARDQRHHTGTHRCRTRAGVPRKDT